MTIRPLCRSSPLTLPQVKFTRPYRGSSRLASQTVFSVLQASRITSTAHLSAGQRPFAELQEGGVARPVRLRRRQRGGSGVRENLAVQITRQAFASLFLMFIRIPLDSCNLSYSLLRRKSMAVYTERSFARINCMFFCRRFCNTGPIGVYWF